MPRFYVDEKKIFSAISVPTEEYIASLILANNDKFSVRRDWVRDGFGIIVECENKPQDSALYGVEWKEVLDN